MKLTSIRLAAVAVLALCTPALAEEMVDNPAYKNWASYKPGTSVTYKQSTAVNMEGQSMKTEATMTQKLDEVTAEKAVVTLTMNMTVMGNTSSHTNKQVIPAKIEKSKLDTTMVQSQGEVKVTNVKDGKDTVEVKGKKVDAVTKEMDVEVTSQGQTMKSHTKVWTSDKVPGGMVKMTSKTKEPMDMDMSMTLSDYETK